MDHLAFYNEKFNNFVTFLHKIKTEHNPLLLRILQWRPQMEEMVRMLTELPPNDTAAPFAMAIRNIKRTESTMAERFVKLAAEYNPEDEEFVQRVREMMSVPKDEVIVKEDALIIIRLFRYIALFLDIIIQ